MSFNRDIKIDPNRVSTGGGGRGAAIGGGSIITVLAVLLISHFTGVDLTGLLGQDQGTTSSATSSIDMSVCGDGTSANGDAANQYPQCRMVATAESLDAGSWTHGSSSSESAGSRPAWTPGRSSSAAPSRRPGGASEESPKSSEGPRRQPSRSRSFLSRVVRRGPRPYRNESASWEKR